MVKMLPNLYLLFIVLHISEGCTVENSGSTLSITARTGESVLLPCSCTDLNSTPASFIWKYIKTQEVTFVQHSNRVLLFNEQYPGNLSLLISHLTEEDAGWYRCDAKISGYIDVILTVKGKPNLGCTLHNNGAILEITAHTGESVLLPCFCTDLRTTPDKFTWRKLNTISNTWEEISSESYQYRNRVQLFNNLSPANLSLLISHLTEEDDGDYSCEVKGSEYTHITVMVKHGSPHSLPFVPFALATGVFLHIIVAVVYCTKRTEATVHYNTDDGDGGINLEQSCSPTSA